MLSPEPYKDFRKSSGSGEFQVSNRQIVSAVRPSRFKSQRRRQWIGVVDNDGAAVGSSLNHQRIMALRLNLYFLAISQCDGHLKRHSPAVLPKVDSRNGS